jgi:hypothetical protein
LYPARSSTAAGFTDVHSGTVADNRNRQLLPSLNEKHVRKVALARGRTRHDGSMIAVLVSIPSERVSKRR